MAKKTLLDNKIENLIQELSAFYRGDYEVLRGEAQQRMEKGEPFSTVFYKVPLGESKREVCFRSQDEGAQTENPQGGPGGIVIDGDTLLEQYQRIFNRATISINGREKSAGDADKSYSKSILVPLFKYGNAASRLVVKSLYLNTVKLLVQISYWEDRGDRDGEMYPAGGETKRYCKKWEEVDVPLRYINHAGKIKECIRDKVNPSLFPRETGPEGIACVINSEEEIDADMIGFTLDAGALSKKQIGKLAFPMDEIGWRKSFRADREIISSERVDPQEIQSKAATEFARFLTLYCLCEDGEAMERLMAAYKARELTQGFTYGIYEEWALQQVYTYLCEHSRQVREEWMHLFDRKDGPFGEYFVGFGFQMEKIRGMELIQRLRVDTQLLSDDELYHRVVEITQRQGEAQ